MHGGQLDSKDYEHREQAYVKHYVLKHYLERLAFKVGLFNPGTTLNYIDGFSGPWDAATDDAKDSSPHIALTALCKVREDLATKGTPFNVRAMFIEKDKAAYQRLTALCKGFPDVTAIPHNGEFEKLIPEAITFASTGPKGFGFLFLDPKGWTGFPLQELTPLLQVRPSEVLINFMTKDITRFVDDTSSTAKQSFVNLFGDEEFRDEWTGLSGLDREDRIVDAYCRRIAAVGRYTYSASAIVLNPNKDRTHYHLVYATRSLKGLITFRETEAAAFPKQQRLRADVKRRQDTQKDLFSPAVLDSSLFDYSEVLRRRHHARADQHLKDLLSQGIPVPYEQVVAEALRFPMFSELDLKGWISRNAANLALLGLQGKERVLKLNRGHLLRWKASE